MRGEEDELAGNVIGWYVAYRVISPLLLAAELVMRARLRWRRRTEDECGCLVCTDDTTAEDWDGPYQAYRWSPDLLEGA